MSNLSNLFISQSFYGIINLENSLEPLTSASGDVELQDGVGDNIGLKINAQTKEFTIVNNFKVDGNADFNGNVDISGSLTHTGSLDVLGDITASGNIKATIGNFDTVNTRVLHVTQESASVIFSSGSNVLGDDETDRQDLIGQVIVSGTLGVEGNSALTGSLTVSGATIISGSLTNKQSVSSEAFKIIAPNGQEVVDILGGNAANKTITLQDSIFLYKSGSTPRMTLQEEGASPKSSTWFPNIIQFPSGAYGNIAQIETQTNAGNREFAFGDSTNVANISGLTEEDGRAGIYFGAFYGFNADFIIGKDKTNNRTIIGGPGTTYMSSSVDIQNNLTVHGDIQIDGNLSSSVIDGLNLFTASQETLNGFYNSFTSSQENINGGYNTFTSSYYIDSASFDLRLDQQEAFSSSLVTDFVTDAQFNPYTASIEVEQAAQDVRINNLELETSSIDNRLDNIELTTSSLQVEIDNLSSLTGSYATTGSNTFDGNQVFSGSVQGNVNALTITSNTASIDCSTGNFFTVNLPSGSTTNLEASNIVPGLTITLQIEQPITGSGNIIFDTDDYSFPRLGQPSLTPQAEAVDIATFVSFDGSKLKGVLTNDII